MSTSDTSPIYIDDFEIDDDNERHMIERHGVYAEDLYEVLSNGAYEVVENEGPHQLSQPYALIGYTDAGRRLYIPIQPTIHEGVWRPATAFDY